MMVGKKKTKRRRKAPKKKASRTKRQKSVGKACRNVNNVVTKRKHDHKKALAKIKSLKNQLRLAERSATKKRNEVLKAQKRAKAICSG